VLITAVVYFASYVNGVH